mmetsp:Transcript_23975/g.52460  ORF Transcript_23975/g.52460 Transcript_23975/m.52460 type:complete len:291 (+) Transcript_23975:299-1171(+)
MVLTTTVRMLHRTCPVLTTMCPVCPSYTASTSTWAVAGPEAALPPAPTSTFCLLVVLKLLWERASRDLIVSSCPSRSSISSCIRSAFCSAVYVTTLIRPVAAAGPALLEALASSGVTFARIMIKFDPDLLRSTTFFVSALEPSYAKLEASSRSSTSFVTAALPCASSNRPGCAYSRASHTILASRLCIFRPAVRRVQKLAGGVRAASAPATRGPAAAEGAAASPLASTCTGLAAGHDVWPWSAACTHLSACCCTHDVDAIISTSVFSLMRCMLGLGSSTVRSIHPRSTAI